MNEKADDTIVVVVEDDQERSKQTESFSGRRYLHEPTRGLSEREPFRAKPIPVGKIGASIASLSEQLNTIFNDIKQVGSFQLKEVQVQVEISSEGGVNLIGTAKAGLKGAVGLTFKCDKRD